jgi:hypothetical protein
MDTAAETKPPYGGFRTFWNFVQQLHEHRPLPQILDRSVMGQRGGSARSELYTALRFFRLIDAEKRPTEKLETVVSDPTPAQLRWLVESEYASLIALDLTTATPRQVDERLAEMGATPSTVARSRTFFLNAAEEAGIEVGRLLKTARAPSSAPRRRAPRKQRTNPVEDEPRKVPPPRGDLPPLIGALVAKLPTEADGWSEDDARQWLALAAPAIAYDYKLDAARLVAGGSSP